MDSNPQKYYGARNTEQLGICNKVKHMRSTDKRQRQELEQLKYRIFMQNKWRLLKEERGKFLDYFIHQNRCKKGIMETIKIIRTYILLKRMKYLIDGMIYQRNYHSAAYMVCLMCKTKFQERLKFRGSTVKKRIQITMKNCMNVGIGYSVRPLMERRAGLMVSGFIFQWGMRAKLILLIKNTIYRVLYIQSCYRKAKQIKSSLFEALQSRIWNQEVMQVCNHFTSKHATSF